MYKWPFLFLRNLLDNLAILLPSFKTEDHSDSVLMIRLDAIGDFIIWSPAATDTIAHHKAKGEKVHLLGNKVWQGYSEDKIKVDDFINFNRGQFSKNPFYRWYKLRLIKSRKYKVVFQPTISREKQGDLIVRASRAETKIGVDGDTSNINSHMKLKNKKYYDKLIPISTLYTTELENNFVVLRELGIQAITRYPDFKLKAVKKDQVIVVPGAQWYGKRWPVDNFIKTIRTLLSKNPVTRVLICGAPDEIHLQEEIQREVKDPRLVGMIGKTSLNELTHIIAESKLLISNDTSAVHMAQATQTKTIAILGGGHFGRFLPYPEIKDHQNYIQCLNHRMDCYQCHWKCPYLGPVTTSVPCVTGITEIPEELLSIQ